MVTIYLQLIQSRYKFGSFTVLHCSHQHCVQPVASDVEVVGYIFNSTVIDWTFFPVAQQSPVGCGLLITEASRSHSVGLLWTSDQPDTETSTWQHTTLTTDIHAAGGIRTRNPSQRSTADPRLRPRGHWDRHLLLFWTLFKLLSYFNGS